MDKRKITDITAIILFLACLIVPLLLFNTKENQVSPIDNTMLPELSDIRSSENITADIDDYISSRIGLRTEAITAYQYINDCLFDELMHPSYTYGTDGYVFFNMPDEKEDKKYLRTFVSYIADMQKYCKKNDIEFLYCINPNKTQIYPDKLPKGANLTFFRQNYLLSQLEDKNINYIDNTTILSEAAKAGVAVFNKKYDAGHWNETGAYIGISNILSKLHETNPIIHVNSEEEFTKTEVVNEFLPMSYFRINEPTTVYERKNSEVIDVTSSDTDIQINETYNDFTHYVNPSHPEYPRILVFRGSYFLGKEKFMNESFSESVFVHSYHNILNMEYYIERYNPDIVLFESVEYATIKKYFPFT